MPRIYQLRAHQAAREAWDEGQGAMLVMATGTGKTASALHIAVEDFLSEGHRVVWLAHREELLNQPMDTLARWWPHHRHRGGIVQAGRDAPDAQIVFASVATLAVPSRLEAVLRHGRPALLVVDECHHSTSPSQKAAIEALRGPQTRLLGLTATPDREDGADLSALWTVAYSYGMTDAVRDGVLLPPYTAVAPLPELDLSAVSGRRDYDDAELGAALMKAHVVEHTVLVMGQTTPPSACPAASRSASSGPAVGRCWCSPPPSSRPARRPRPWTRPAGAHATSPARPRPPSAGDCSAPSPRVTSRCCVTASTMRQRSSRGGDGSASTTCVMTM